MVDVRRDRLLKEFRRHDTDSDGLVGVEDLLRNLTSDDTLEDEIKSKMAKFDVDNDGFLNFTEFKRYINSS